MNGTAFDLTSALGIDRVAPLEFLRTAYEPFDWIAVLLKRHETAEVLQRVGPIALFQRPNVQAWLRRMNAQRFNVYISINAITPGLRTRTRDAIGAIRHVFLDVDENSPTVLTRIAGRADLPDPSYTLHSSPGRVHVLWRATGFTRQAVEHLQRQLADELGTDLAATPCTQTTRMPGFLNHKYTPAAMVGVTYNDVCRAYAPDDFPRVRPVITSRPAAQPFSITAGADVLSRARRYLSALPAAVAGQHGDLTTFRVCCRLVRGFRLTNDEALSVLHEWNRRCEPPWREHELAMKVRHARRYGREPLGGLLESNGRSEPWKP